MRYNLGIDVGGTFTDVLVFDPETGSLTVEKVLSTPEDQSIGLLNGIRQACATLGSGIEDLRLILHGSTVVTNMILEEKGARGGLLVTRGHRDILHLARAWTPGPLYGWMGMHKPDPIVDLCDTREIGERIDASGAVVEPLDEAEVRAAVDDLVASGIETLTIAFLNSYVNPEHERRARAVVQDAYPDLPVSISSEMVSEYREYERTLTTVINAYVRPQVIRYVRNLAAKLEGMGFRGRLNIVRSDGGTMSTQAAQDRPVDITFSGPSGGVVGAAYLARQIGVPNVLTLDMGGTSTDVSLVRDGIPSIQREVQIGYYRFNSRTVDVHSVGAGGGSIAYLTLAGSLRVGPRSAGADPGPACYGRGGTEPTVTDANVVLHRIPPGTRLAGTLELDEEAARRAVAKVADGLGISLEAGAQAILDIANENMHAALRVVSVERGYDPREFGLVVFGGAGPLHANALSRLIHASPVIIPATPGVLSAFGFLASDVQNEFARTYLKIAEETPVEDLRRVLQSLHEEAVAWLESEGVPPADRSFDYFADCRYYRQDIQISCRLSPDALGEDYAAALRADFEAQHQRRYGFDLDAPIEIATLRVVGRGAMRGITLPTIEEGGEDPSAALDRYEQVYFNGAWQRTPIYRRYDLKEGNRLQGPAIVIQDDSTVVIEPGYSAVVDRFANLIIRGDGA